MKTADIKKNIHLRNALILIVALLGLQTARAQNLIGEGDALSNRVFNSDNGPTNSQLTLDFPITQAGVLQNILTWGENSGMGGINGVGQSFELFVLRPVNTTNYLVAFATGYMAVTNIGTNNFGVSGTPFGLQVGDVIAHYGRGIPFNNGTGGPSSVYIAANLPPPSLGTTITVPGSVYPVYDDGGRNYAIQVLALGQPFLVTTNSDNGPGSLRQAALNAAALGGTSTISFATNLSGQTILLTSGQIELANNVTIDASTLANGVQINGNASSRIFQVDGGATVVLDALTITNGSDNFGGFAQGGGVVNSGLLTLNNCTVTGNQANFSDGGGGICNVTGLLTVNNCFFSGNQANPSFFGGGAICVGGDGDGGTVNVNNCTFSGDQAAYGGAIAIAGGTVNINNSTLSGNQAFGYGGGVDIFSGLLNLTNSIVCANSPNNIDAPVNSSASNLVDTNALLAPLGNYGGPTPTMPPYAGSPAIDAGSDSVTNFLTTDQRGHSRQSGTHVDIGAVEVNPNTIVTNLANSGAGTLRTIIASLASSDLVSFAPNLSGQTISLSGVINLNQSLTIDASPLTNGITLNANFSDRIFIIAGGTTSELTGLTLVNAFISGGFSAASGGALQNFGTVTFNQCSFTGNTASTGNGGAIYNGGTLTLMACSLSGNSATSNFNSNGGLGGAVYNDGTVTLVQCTLAGNSVGAIFNEGVLALTQCTVSSNSAGSAIFTGTGAHVTMTDTIVAGNLDASFAGNDFNTDNSTNIFLGTNIVQFITSNGGASSGTAPINVNPQLAPLGSYGGPTQTMPPQFGSAAINAGSDASATGLATDQRGQPRISGTHVDIGAVEFQAGLMVSSKMDSGENTLRAALLYNSPGSTITFTPNLSSQAILLTNGPIVLSNNVTIDGSGLPGAVQLNGNGTSRIFLVNSGTTAVLDSLTLTNGLATTGNAGGGLLNNGTLTVNNCTLVGNNSTVASIGGGAIHNSGTLIVNNSTLALNHSAFVGGAIGNANSVTMKVNDSTIVSNSAASNGGGIYNNGGFLDLTNSLVAGNSPLGADIVNTATFNQASNIFDTAKALVAPLGNYGGPTQTMPPLAGSPAIDKGAATILTTDQRGYPRPSGAGVDIGAVEVQVAGAPFLLGGISGIAGAVQLANGQAQIDFTNLAGGSFTVFATTNVALPFNTWSNLGTALELPAGSGQFQFTDPHTTNFPSRFYRVTSP